MKTKNVCTQALNILKENPPKSVDNFQRGLDRYWIGKIFIIKKKTVFIRYSNCVPAINPFTQKKIIISTIGTHFSMGANKLV